MKILQICNFSAGITGTWSRVLETSKQLSKNHQVYIFSSNLKNNKPTAKLEEKIGKIKIKRFPVKRKIGFALWFDFEKQALKLKPDIIIAQGFRKPYLKQVLKISKKIKAKTFLVTHAPFVNKNLRSKKLRTIIWLYDKIYAKKILNSFNKIIAITKWEIPKLLKLGAKKQNIVYIPNPISEKFFSKPKKGKNILFLGRVSPIKNLETPIKAINTLEKKPILNIVGPAEQEYKQKLIKGIQKRKLQKNVIFSKPVYNLQKKIKLIDEHEIFILSSKREGLPVSLIEAMARGKICISSRTQGGSELITNTQNGFLFDIGNFQQLSKIMQKIQKMPEKQKNKIKKAAMSSAQEFKSIKIIKKLKSLF